MLLDHLSEYRHKHLLDDTVAGLFIQLRIAVHLKFNQSNRCLYFERWV